MESDTLLDCLRNIKNWQNTYLISKLQYKLIYCVYPCVRYKHITKGSVFKSGFTELEPNFWFAYGQVQIFSHRKKNSYIDIYEFM